MNGLIFDTSTHLSYIVLYKNFKTVETKFFKENFLNSQKFLNEIKEFLHDENISLDELDYIATGIGPGSYTGLRVSASIAQAFSFAKKIPLITYSSLIAYIPDNNGSFLSVYDAKRGGIYILSGKKDSNKIIFSKDHIKLPDDEAIILFNEKDYIITPHKTKIFEKFKNSNLQLNEKIIQKNPDFEFLANFSKNLFFDKKFVKKPFVNLIYW